MGAEPTHTASAAAPGHKVLALVGSAHGTLPAHGSPSRRPPSSGGPAAVRGRPHPQEGAHKSWQRRDYSTRQPLPLASACRRPRAASFPGRRRHCAQMAYTTGLQPHLPRARVGRERSLGRSTGGGEGLVLTLGSADPVLSRPPSGAPGRASPGDSQAGSSPGGTGL